MSGASKGAQIQEESVRRRLSFWRGPIAVSLVLTLGFVIAAPPIAAAEAEAVPQAQPTSLVAAANRVAASQIPARALTQASRAAQATPGAADTLQGKSFWKTKPGVIALVLMTAGTGYMVYSAFKDNDPVHSQYR